MWWQAKYDTMSGWGIAQNGLMPILRTSSNSECHVTSCLLMEENAAIRSREPCRETTWRWASPVNKVTVESRHHFLVVCIEPRTFSQLSNMYGGTTYDRAKNSGCPGSYGILMSCINGIPCPFSVSVKWIWFSVEDCHHGYLHEISNTSRCRRRVNLWSDLRSGLPTPDQPQRTSIEVCWPSAVPEDLDISGEEGVSGSVSFTGTGWESNGEFRPPGSISSGLGESKGHRVFKQLFRGNRKSNRMIIKRNHRSPYTLGGSDWIEG